MDRAQIDRTKIQGRNCMVCVHLMEGDDQLYCPIFNERILFPSIAAADCPKFQPEEVK